MPSIIRKYYTPLMLFQVPFSRDTNRQKIMSSRFSKAINKMKQNSFSKK